MSLLRPRFYLHGFGGVWKVQYAAIRSGATPDEIIHGELMQRTAATQGERGGWRGLPRGVIREMPDSFEGLDHKHGFDHVYLCHLDNVNEDELDYWREVLLEWDQRVGRGKR